MDLNEIKKPIKKDLEEFNNFFGDVLKTDITFLTIVLKYMAKKKGKQIRPILVLLTSGMVSEINKRSNIGAAMIELLHTATLVHDDVVDGASVRRGLASINAEFNNKVAVLVGDYLLSKGLQISVDHNEAKFLSVTSRAVQKMSESELMAMDKSKDFNISEEDYYRIIDGKTASLISSCCEIGAISSSDKEDDHDRLREFGTKLGLAFQLRDDLFDYTAKQTLIGKPVGNDLKEKKLTLPLLHSIKNAEKSEGKKIIKMVKSGKLDKKDINYIIDFVKNSGGVDYTYSQAQKLIDDAKNLISVYNDSVYKQSLISLSDFIVERAS